MPPDAATSMHVTRAETPNHNGNAQRLFELALLTCPLIPLTPADSTPITDSGPSLRHVPVSEAEDTAEQGAQPADAR